MSHSDLVPSESASPAPWSHALNGLARIGEIDPLRLEIPALEGLCVQVRGWLETLAPASLSASDEDQRKLGWQSWFRLHDALERRTGLKTRPTVFRVSRPAAPPLS